MKHVEDFVWWLRAVLYVAMFIAFFVYCIFHSFAYETPIFDCADQDPESQEFWPPDMIPHPTVPGDGPKKHNEGDMA